MADSDIDMPTAAAGRADRLLAITLELNRMRNPDALLDFIIETAADVLGCEATSILLFDDATDQLHFAAATGANPDSLAEIPVPLNDSIAGTIFTTNAPLIIDDTAAQRAELTTYLEEEYRSGRLSRASCSSGWAARCTSWTAPTGAMQWPRGHSNSAFGRWRRCRARQRVGPDGTESGARISWTTLPTAPASRWRAASASATMPQQPPTSSITTTRRT